MPREETTYLEQQVVIPSVLASRLEQLVEGQAARAAGLTMQNVAFWTDLDDCTANTAWRTIWIMDAFLTENQDLLGEAWCQEASRTARELASMGQFPYLAADAWRVIAKEEWAVLTTTWMDWWKSRFFTNEALLHDRPMPGARDLLSHISWSAGLPIGYLTGRHLPNTASRFPDGMELGTMAWLWSQQMPNSGLLQMKPSFDGDDVAYKRDFFAHLLENRQRMPIGYIDNEPSCVIAHHEVMSEAGLPHISVWYAGVHRTPRELPAEILVLTSFEQR